MKKLAYLLLFVGAISFSSCENDDLENAELVQNQQATDKKDAANPNNTGGGSTQGPS